MHRTRTASLLAFIVVLAACDEYQCGFTQSLQPFYLEEQVVSAPEFVGKWQLPDEPRAYWVLEEDDDESTYLLSAWECQQQIQWRWKVHFWKLGDTMWLDMFPVAPEDDLWVVGFVRTHGHSRVERRGDRVFVKHLDADWFVTAATNGEVDIPYLQPEGFSTLLIGTTQEIQQLLWNQKDNDEAFEDLYPEGLRLIEGTPIECASEAGEAANPD